MSTVRLHVCLSSCLLGCYLSQSLTLALCISFTYLQAAVTSYCTFHEYHAEVSFDAPEATPTASYVNAHEHRAAVSLDAS